MSQFSNPKKVMIPCRFSFLHCWEPDSVNGSEPKYSVSAIIPKSDTKTVNAIKAAIADYYRRQGIDPTPIVGELPDPDEYEACHV